MQKCMNIKQYLQYASEVLKAANIETPVVEAGVMLCHVLNCNKVYLYSHDDRVLENIEMQALDQMLVKRTEKVPLQYIVGQAKFMSLSFVVSPGVLIPRQDTEILVEKCAEIVNSIVSDSREQEASKSTAMKAGVNNQDSDKGLRIEEKSSKINVLDMCTGSGCIAVSIANYFPQSSVEACDISEDALRIAEINIRRNGVQGRVTLHHGDLFEALDSESVFDLIISNPPYIETDVISGLQNEVKDHEPCIALDGGQDGLDFYKRIIAEAPKYLKNRGILAFEIGFNQAGSVSNLMKSNFKNISVFKDIGGNDRVVIGQLIV